MYLQALPNIRLWLMRKHGEVNFYPAQTKIASVLANDPIAFPQPQFDNAL